MKEPRKLRSAKAGMAPGSLVHIGEVKTGRASLSLIDYGPDGFEERPLAGAGELQGMARPERVLWLNMYGVHAADTLRAVGDAFGLHPLVLEDILNTDQRQKVDAYPGYLYLVLHRYELAAASHDLVQEQISLIVGRDFILSFQERSSSIFEPVRQRLRADRGGLRRGGTDMLAYSLIDSVVDSYFAIVEQLNERAELLEEQVLGKPTPVVLEGIHQMKRCVSRLRRNLYPLREVLVTLNRDAGDFFRSEVEIYLRDVHDHIIHILESLDDLRDLTTGLLDVYLSTVSHRLNLEVRTLTVVTTLFMPAALIAGIFGMNFRLMPWLDSPDGFINSLGLMAAVALAMLLVFWRRRSP